MAMNVRAIHEKDFKYKMRGYDDVEVDDFLDEVAEEFERLTRENADLKKKLESSGEQTGYVKNLEGTLRDTLVMAQRTAEETTKEAQAKASAIIANAEKEAAHIKADSEDQVIALREEFRILKKRASDFVDSQHRVMADLLAYFESKSEELGYEMSEQGQQYADGFDNASIGDIGGAEEPPPPSDGFGEPQGDGDFGDTMVFKSIR